MGVLAASEEQNARTREISLLRIDIKKKAKILPGENSTLRITLRFLIVGKNIGQTASCHSGPLLSNDSLLRKKIETS